MRPLLQHASRSVFANAALVAPSRSSTSSIRNFTRSVSRTPSICFQCQFRASLAPSLDASSRWPSQTSKSIRRRFHQTPNDERRPPDGKVPSPEVKPSPDASEPTLADTPPAPKKDANAITTSKKEEVVDDIARVPAEDLPSHRDAQRWDFSKRFTELMDELLPKLAVVTQKVNTYTGTDYSGIEALRREIKEQENLVKARRAAIEEAKQALDVAHAQQASSQKEVVALLERKHSWSATDLERYMSLIRSEHVNDQAVREAKEAVAAAESALEEARSQLERRERAQYHEEQIWSDTIRRNSTWVTFGLMGVNILLLLASLVVLEPWRRRRMVREIKMALEAQKAAAEPAVAAEMQTTTSVAAIEAIGAEVDKAVEPIGSITAAESSPTVSPTQGRSEVSVEDVPGLQETLLDVSAEPAASGTAPLIPDEVVPQESISIEEEVKTSKVLGSIRDKVTFVAKDVISERIISMRRIDFTTVIIQSAAAGAIIAAAIIGLLRPR